MEIKTEIVDMLKWRLAQWFELRWWQHYLQDKNKEEYLLWKKNYWKKIFELLPREIQLLDTICDLGCGPAGVFIALANNKVTAVDPLIDDYEKSVAVFKKDDYPNTVFAKSTVETFKSDLKFDWVFCMNVINHVQNIEKGFDVLAETVAENGHIIFSVDAHNHPFFKFLFRLIPADALHPHQYDLHEYKAFFEKRGMKVLKAELLKKEFFFGHWLIIAQKQIIS